MADTLKLINAEKLVSETRAHIVRAGHLLKLSEAMRAYMEAMNKRPTKPTLRIKKNLTEFLTAYLREPVNLWFTIDRACMGNGYSLKVTLPKYKDGEDVLYYIKVDGDYVVDIPHSMMSHAQWGGIQTELEKRVEDIPAKAAEFNRLLNELQAVSEFALPTGTLHPLYPLATPFGWYELHRI